MLRNIHPAVTFAIFLLSSFLLSCNKLDTTDVGSDLIPTVDNIHTFDTVLTVNATQGIFDDTTSVGRSQNHVLGNISNDPLFGTTRANIYFQLKPTFFPYYFGSPKDTINPAFDPKTGFDSVVLCLSFKGFWGDSALPQQFIVKEVTDENFRDSVNKSRSVKYQPNTGAVLGTTMVDIRQMPNWIKFTGRKDSVRNQIRIKLSDAFANSIFNCDTTAPSGNFRTDSLFRKFLNGFAVEAGNMGNALMYCNLDDAATSLEVYYRRKNGGAVDTAFSSFRLNAITNLTAILPSATANNVVRNRAGFPVSNPSQDEIYLQTSPGTYADLTIPALSTLSNRIVHRAELIVEQIPTDPIMDNIFKAPTQLYIDLKDTTVDARWKPIYFDLDPNVLYNPDAASGFFPSRGINFNYFGGFVRTKKDQFNNFITYYNFNITRYVQKIVTTGLHNYPLRLYAPYELFYPQYSAFTLGYNNSLAFGRIKVGSGTNANYKMRLRIIYSKL